MVGPDRLRGRERPEPLDADARREEDVVDALTRIAAEPLEGPLRPLDAVGDPPAF